MSGGRTDKYDELGLLELAVAPIESDAAQPTVDLVDGGTMRFPARATRALIAIVELPASFANASELPGVPAGSRVRGTGFFIYRNGLFVTAAHLSSAVLSLEQLVEDRRVAALVFGDRQVAHLQPILALIADESTDVAVGCLGMPTSISEFHYLPISPLPLPEDMSGLRCVVAGFQETLHDDERIDLNPKMFHGGPVALDQQPVRMELPGNMYRLVNGPFIVARAKAKRGISGGPMMLVSRDPSQPERGSVWSGQVHGIASWIAGREPFYEGEVLLHCVPSSRCLDLRLRGPGFAAFEGRTLREIAGDVAQS